MARTCGAAFAAFFLAAAPAGAELAAPPSAISVRADGTLHGDAGQLMVTADGRYAIFATTDALVSTDTNAARDVYRRDLTTGATALVSRKADTANAGNGNSDPGGISKNGRFVVFSSTASDIASPDADTQGDVFVRDMQTGTNRLLSVNAAGTASGNGGSLTPSGTNSITPDGRYVAFGSDASDLVSTDSNGSGDLFRRDLQTNTTELISERAAGGDTGDAGSFAPLMSDSGRFILFQTAATNLTSLPDANAMSDVVYRDMDANSNKLVSVNSAGTAAADGFSAPTDITPDGRFVAFNSQASNVTTHAQGMAGGNDVFRRNMATNQTVLVSINFAGTATGNSHSAQLVLSDDGRRGAWQTFANDLGPAGQDTGALFDVYWRDINAGATRLVSIRQATGTVGDGGSAFPLITPTGRYVSFQSQAGNLLPGSADDNGASDIYRRDTQRGVTRLMSMTFDRTKAAYGEGQWLLPNGDVAFVSPFSNLTPPGVDAGGNDAFIVRNRRPTASLRATPRAGTLRATFDGSGGDLEAGVTARLDFGDGTSHNGFDATHDYRAPGSYTARLTVTDADGATATSQVRVNVSGGPPPRGDARPAASRFGMTRRRFAVGRRATPVNQSGRRRRARAKRGSAFRYRLSESARVRITIQRRTTGRRAGRRCVKRTKRNAKRRKCTRYVRAGALNRSGKLGANRHSFSGRIGRRKLRPGRYRATLVATDSAGQRSTARRVTFRIVKR